MNLEGQLLSLGLQLDTLKYKVWGAQCAQDLIDALKHNRPCILGIWGALFFIWGATRLSVKTIKNYLTNEDFSGSEDPEQRIKREKRDGQEKKKPEQSKRK